MKQNIKKITFYICALLSILFIFLILTDHITWFDTTVYEAIITIKGEKMTNLFLGISSVTIPFILISILFWLFYPKKMISFFVSFHLAFSFILSNLLKLIFKRNRPVGIALTFEPGYSMPSSHAMVSMIFLGFLISLVFISGKKAYQKYIVSFFLILFIFCIGISRIYLGVHYASDVLLGIFLGILYLLLFFHLKKVKTLFQKKDESEKGE